MAEIHQLYIAGLTPDPASVSPPVAEIICQADVLAGGDRLLDMFRDHPGQKIKLTTPLSGWLAEIKQQQEEGRKVVVLASGDPNYFGLARMLFKVIDPARVTVLPSVTTVQMAFARLKTSWEKVEVVSLHGHSGLSERKDGGLTGLWGALYRASHQSGSGYLAIYTDPKNTPAQIAKRLLGRGQGNWRMTVFEDLGTPDEAVTSLSLFEAKSRSFSPLNLVVLECLKKPVAITLGMPESVYVHEAGLITKKEIRSVALGLLELHPHHLMWDLGAGSGSVSIEAAAFLSHGFILAVEKSPLRAEQIAANRAFFGAAQVEIVEDDAMAAMVHLPSPDRVFIGGGGENLEAIIKAARARLNSGGIIVANVVTLRALDRASRAMTDLGLELSITQLQASRSETLGDSLYLRPCNQVWLVRGTLASAEITAHQAG